MFQRILVISYCWAKKVSHVLLVGNSKLVAKMQNRKTENLRKLYVGNLAPSTSEQSLRQYFGRWGHVLHVFNPKRTYAFVTFSTEESARECIGAGPHTLNGRVVHVDLGKNDTRKGLNDTRKGPTEKSHKPPYRETRAPPSSGQRESRDQGFDLRQVLEEKRSTSGGTRGQAAHSRQGQQSAREKHSTLEFDKLKEQLREEEGVLKLEESKAKDLKQIRDQKTKEIENLRKAIVGVKRREEAVKEKRAMQEQILAFKQNLEKKTSAQNIVKETLSENIFSNSTPENLVKKTVPEQESESDPPNHGRPGKTEREKIALKLQKMKEINMKK